MNRRALDGVGLALKGVVHVYIHVATLSVAVTILIVGVGHEMKDITEGLNCVVDGWKMDRWSSPPRLHTRWALVSFTFHRSYQSVGCLSPYRYLSPSYVMSSAGANTQSQWVPSLLELDILMIQINYPEWQRKEEQFKEVQLLIEEEEARKEEEEVRRLVAEIKAEKLERHQNEVRMLEADIEAEERRRKEAEFEKHVEKRLQEIRREQDK